MKETLRQQLSRVPGAWTLARIIAQTVRICMRYRVTGLAAEAGFFALLSFPPLIFGILGGVGYLGDWLGQNNVARVTTNIETYAARFLTEDSLRQVLMPTIRDALRTGRPDVISVGFVLSLWSGSRALNVLLDTVSIMYGQGGLRGIVRTRVMSLSLYVGSLVFSAVTLPLLVIGPELLTDWLPKNLKFMTNFYWPAVGGLTIIGLATLFYIATPKRTPWVRDLPGAVLTLSIWVVASMFLRWALGHSVGGVSIYGPLAAAIVVLTWLYFLGIAVLIGAAMNAATARIWPVEHVEPMHEKAIARIGEGVTKLREREALARAQRRRAAKRPLRRSAAATEPVQDQAAAEPDTDLSAWEADDAHEREARLDSPQTIG